MKLKRELKLLIGLRWSGSSVKSIGIQTEVFLNEINSLEASLKIPLHWNFSLAPLLDPSGPGNIDSRLINNLIMEIKTRIKSRRDKVIPTGFQGAIHPLLAPDELERELDWCRKNPWLPGFKEVFGQEPEIIMPVYPDLLRELSHGVYSNRGFKALGLPGTYNKPSRTAVNFRLKSRAQRAALFSYWLLPLIRYRQLLRNPKPGLPGDGVLFILLDLSPDEDLSGEVPGKGLLKPLLELLSNRYSLSLCSLSDPGILPAKTDTSSKDSYLPGSPGEALQAQADQGVMELSESQLLDPGLVQDLVRTDPQSRRRRLPAEPFRRKKKKSAADYRAILNVLSDADSDGLRSVPSDKPLRRDRTLVANMSGAVELTGNSFEANFQGGRFAGLSVRGRQILCGKPSLCYLKISGKKYHFWTESAFSFQSSGSTLETGLRTVFIIALPEAEEDRSGKLIVDSYFIDDQPELILDFQVLYPWLDTGLKLNEVVPFEIPLFTFIREDRVLIQSIYPQGLRCTFTVNGKVPLQILWGSRFIFSKNDKALVLSFNDKNNPSIGLLQLRCRRRGRRYTLLVNLGGSYKAVNPDLYSRQEDHFSFKFSPADR